MLLRKPCCQLLPKSRLLQLLWLNRWKLFPIRLNLSFDFADAFRTYFGILRLTKDLSGTPLNLNFWRTNIELSRIRSMGCMSVSYLKLQFMKLNASEGRLPCGIKRSNRPFTVPGSVNKFVKNLSVTHNYIYKKSIELIFLESY